MTDFVKVAKSKLTEPSVFPVSDQDTAGNVTYELLINTFGFVFRKVSYQSGKILRQGGRRYSVEKPIEYILQEALDYTKGKSQNFEMLCPITQKKKIAKILRGKKLIWNLSQPHEYEIMKQEPIME